MPDPYTVDQVSIVKIAKIEGKIHLYFFLRIAVAMRGHL